jgi:BR serine/threonine kinase
LSNSHNTEKVIYFLLLERKRRRPAFEDDTEAIVRVRSESSDPPRKRIDTCKVNGTATYQFGQISEGSPLTPRRQQFKYVSYVCNLHINEEKKVKIYWTLAIGDKRIIF